MHQTFNQMCFLHKQLFWLRDFLCTQINYAACFLFYFAVVLKPPPIYFKIFLPSGRQIEYFFTSPCEETFHMLQKHCSLFTLFSSDRVNHNRVRTVSFLFFTPPHLYRTDSQTLIGSSIAFNKFQRFLAFFFPLKSLSPTAFIWNVTCTRNNKTGMSSPFMFSSIMLRNPRRNSKYSNNRCRALKKKSVATCWTVRLFLYQSKWGWKVLQFCSFCLVMMKKSQNNSFVLQSGPTRPSSCYSVRPEMNAAKQFGSKTRFWLTMIFRLVSLLHYRLLFLLTS